MAEEDNHLKTMDTVSKYLLDLFKSKLAVPEDGIPRPFCPPIEISSRLLIDCEQMSTILAKAYRRHIYVPWSAAEYDQNTPPRPSGFDGPVEERLAALFEKAYEKPFPYVQEPCIVVDKDGIILAWYLPAGLTFERQSIMWDSMHYLQPFFRGGCATGPWRNLKDFFRNIQECIMSMAGTVNFSPAWFEQGHETAADDMNMSASLKQGRNGDKGRQWLTASGESLALLSAVLRVIHPELYALGRSTMEKLAGRADLFDVVKIWSSVFNGLQVISNRECPIHRDNKSRSEWYDLLATIGPYRSAVFEMPGIGIRLAYPTGTVIGLCGRVLRHGVSAADGERICIAQYMRENVQRRVGNINTGWSRWDYYRNLDT